MSVAGSAYKGSGGSSEAAGEPTMGRKRKATDNLEGIKSKLTKIRVAVIGTKPVLKAKLQAIETIEALAASKDINGKWTTSDVMRFIDFLTEDQTRWALADVQFAFNLLNTRSCSRSISPRCKSFVDATRNFVNAHQPPAPRLKTATVTADELVPLMKRLANKPPAKWTQSDINEVIQRYGNVHSIDGPNSTRNALQQYSVFLSQLLTLYALRPDLKAIIDPEVVMFDTQNADFQLYTTEIVAYIAAAPPGTIPVIPPHLNPTAVPTVFPMPSSNDADYIIAHMRARVPNVRAIVMPQYPGAAVIY